jgi:hypothetical protein
MLVNTEGFGCSAGGGSEIQELRDSGIAEFRNYGIGKLENGKNKK